MARGRNSRSRGVNKTRKTAIKINRAISSSRISQNFADNSKKMIYKDKMPNGFWPRMKFRLKPKHLYEYWFSKQGAIMALRIIGISIVVFFLLIIALFAYYRKDLPKFTGIDGQNLGGSISYYDRSGQHLIYQDNNGIVRLPVSSDKISQYLKEATIAVEDKNFYKEGAFDLKGILRAAFHDIFGIGSGLQGGSTITQQLVKLNENWTNDHTISRKIKELILAVEIEREYSKDQVLNGYLNIAPYGGENYGAQAAAKAYFNGDANLGTDKITAIAEATFLAAIPKSPGVYSPYSSLKYNPSSDDSFNKKGLLDRQQYILRLMVQQKYITQAEADSAAKVDVLAKLPVPLTTQDTTNVAPQFIDSVKSQLQNQLGGSVTNKGGLKVITTLDWNLQQNAENDIANNVNNAHYNNADVQAMVGEDVQTGQVVMQTQGVETIDANGNRAATKYCDNALSGSCTDWTNSEVYPGSSLKPFVYSAFMENNNNVGAGSVLFDASHTSLSAGGATWYACTNGNNCANDWDSYLSSAPAEWMTLRYALAGSRNVPAMKAALSVLPNDKSFGHQDSLVKFANTYSDLTGYSNNLWDNQTGATQHYTTADMKNFYLTAEAATGNDFVHISQQVNADASLARLGNVLPQSYILKISSSEGKVLYQWTQPKGHQAIRQDTAYIIDNILSDPNATYLGPSYGLQHWSGWDTAVKTGTNNISKTGVMTAWNTKYAVVSVVTSRDMTTTLAGFMENITGPLTKTWQKQALQSLPDFNHPTNWTAPSDIKNLPSYKLTGPTDGRGYANWQASPSTDIFPSWFVQRNGSSSSTVSIDKVSTKIHDAANGNAVEYQATSCTPDLAKQNSSGLQAGGFSVDIFYPKQFDNMTAFLQAISPGTTSLAQDDIHNCSDNKPNLSLTINDSKKPSNTDSNGNPQCNPTCTITVTATGGTYDLNDTNNLGDQAGTIKIYLSTDMSNPISTITIPAGNNPYSTTFNYTPTTAGSFTINGVVTDSVLYQSNTSVNAVATGKP